MKLSNIELKKALKEKNKHLDNYKIDIEIWREEKEEYYYQVTFFNLDTEECNAVSYGDNTTKENCVKEGKVIKKYLEKHFDNVNLTYVEI